MANNVFTALEMDSNGVGSDSNVCLCFPKEECNAPIELDPKLLTHTCHYCKVAKVCGICIGEEGFLNPKSKQSQYFHNSSICNIVIK